MTSGQRTTVEEASRHEGELNQRQRHVLDLIVQGRTNPEIATDLGITLDGAKWHVSEILTKLGFSNREEAAHYWRQRNRPGTRLRRAFRGLLGIPVVKVAVGTGVAGSVAGIGIAAWLLLAGGSDDRPVPTVPPFELEARVTISASTLGGVIVGPGTITDETTGTIRLWFRDAGHWRQDVELVSHLESRTMVAAAAGDTQLLYDSSTNTVSHTPNQRLPDGYLALPEGFLVLGPLPSANLDALMESWRHAGGSPRTAESVGKEVVLGRQTTIVELGPTSITDSNGNQRHIGHVRLWIDPKRMFAMRMSSIEQGWSNVTEVTRLRYDLPARDVSTAFTPPPGATEEVIAGGSSSGSASAAGNSVPARLVESDGITRPRPTGRPGFLLPSYVPAGYGAASESWEDGPGGSRIAVEDFLVGDGPHPPPYLRILQRKRADGLPAALRTGAPSRVDGHDTYRGTNGTARTLAWEQDGISVLLTADALPYEELERVAASMSLVP